MPPRLTPEAVAEVLSLKGEFCASSSQALQFYRAQQRWSDAGKQIAHQTARGDVAAFPWQQVALLGQITKLLVEESLARAISEKPTSVAASTTTYWIELDPPPLPIAISANRVVVAGDFVTTASYLISKTPEVLELLFLRMKGAPGLQPHLKEALSTAIAELQIALPFEVTEFDTQNSPLLRFNCPLREFVSRRADYLENHPSEPNPIFEEALRILREMKDQEEPEQDTDPSDDEQGIERQDDSLEAQDSSLLLHQLSRLLGEPQNVAPELRRLLNPESLLRRGVQENAFDDLEASFSDQGIRGTEKLVFQRIFALACWISPQPPGIRTPQALALHRETIADRLLEQIEHLEKDAEEAWPALGLFMRPLSEHEIFERPPMRDIRRKAIERWTKLEQAPRKDSSRAHPAASLFVFHARFAAESAHAVFMHRVWLQQNYPRQ